MTLDRMTLRRKLVILLSCFALFVVGVTTATIYAVHLYIDDALDRFNLWTTEAGRVDRLRTALVDHTEALTRLLHEPSGVERFSTSQSYLFQLLEAPTHAPNAPPGFGQGLENAARRLREDTDEFVALIRASRMPEAGELLHDRIARVTAPDLERQLLAARPALEAWRRQSDAQLVQTGERVLLLAIGVVGGAAILLMIGAHLVGRWLILPIADLQHATEQYRRGRLDFRTRPRSGDELGQLAAALNSMAESLSEADRVLAASERKYRALFENLRDALLICEADGTLLECHDSDTSILALPGGRRVRGAPLWEVWPDWRPEGLDLRRLVERVARQGYRWRGQDVVLVPADAPAEPLVADLVAFPIEIGERTCAALVLRDARERQRLERRVREGEKMEAVGRFAGGIAHDFNNLLTGAIGSLSLLKDAPGADRAGDRIATALQACWQAAGLSRRLLHFARGGRGRPATLRAAQIVETILTSQNEEFLRGLEVIRDLDDTVLVRMDKDELTQVILNLVINAREAMAEGGRLALTVGRAGTGPSATPLEGQPCAMLRVADTGPGIPPDVRRRIFEPFFTTKNRAAHRGSGLGLAIVYAAVRNAGGDIVVESEPGRGATFTVFLPEAGGSPESTREEITPLGPIEAGQTILVVDDDPMVLRTCVDALEGWRCRVLTAGGLAEARAALRTQSGADVTLALIDVALPDGSGYELAQELLHERRGLRVAVMSGFAEAPVPPGLEPRLEARLDKPFGPESLASLLTRRS